MGQETWGIAFGAGTALLSFFARMLFPTVPRAISWAGIIAGLLSLAAAFVAVDMRPPIASLVCAVVGCLFFGAAVHFYVARTPAGQPLDKTKETRQMPEKPTQYAPGGIINNQVGGIANNTVNNISVPKAPPRKLDASGRNSLLSMVPKEKPVIVRSVVNDADAHNFGNEIYAFLKASGYSMAEESPMPALFSPGVVGVQINPHGPQTQVSVGSAQ